MIRNQLGKNNRDISIIRSRRPSHALEIAERAASDKIDMVVAAGGDGTVNSIAQGLINSNTALGVLPTGSGNGFARNMGIPLRVNEAVELIRNPKIITIDVGRVGDHIFLVSCGIGLEAVIATLFEGSRIRGLVPYATATISTFLQYEPQEITITTEPDGWSYRGRPMLFSIANMREFGVNVTIAPDAVYDDGLLDICMIPRHSLVNTIKYTPEMFRERADKIPGYIHHLAKKIIVSRPITGNIHFDGTPEPAGHEITIEVIPASLRVAVKKDT